MIRRHVFDAADNRRLAHLCGPLDAHLRQIESALGVTLARRDASFRIEGPRDGIERTVRLLDALYAKAQHPIGERALQLALLDYSAAAQASAAGAAQPDVDGVVPEPVVLHTRHSDLVGRTPNQAQYLRQMLAHDITFGIGPAGTGKTFLAVACAVDALERHGVQRIVLTRPAVEAGERLGFLPGDLAQKVDPYLRPLYDALYDLMGFDRVHQGLREGPDRDRAARLHARAHAQPCLRDPRRGAEHHARADEDVPHPHRLRQPMRGHRRREPDRPARAACPAAWSMRRRCCARVAGIAFTHFTAADVVRHPLVARIVEAYDARQGCGQRRAGEACGGRALKPALQLSLQFADPRHRALLPRHRVARWMRAALAAPAADHGAHRRCRRGPRAQPRLPRQGLRDQRADLRLRARAAGAGRPGAVRAGGRAPRRARSASPSRPITRTCWSTVRCTRKASSMTTTPMRR